MIPAGEQLRGGSRGHREHGAPGSRLELQRPFRIWFLVLGFSWNYDCMVLLEEIPIIGARDLVLMFLKSGHDNTTPALETRCELKNRRC